MIYVHKTGLLNQKQEDELGVKEKWKAVAPKMIRRTDRYIQLSLLGAYAAVGDTKLDVSTALYMASGQGNLAVFKRLRDQRYIHKQPPKPVDFINSLSNTSGFYVAQFFGLHGKNLNVSRQGLVVENILLLAQSDLESGREREALLGGVDELQEPVDFTRRTLGICDERPLGEGSNWMLLNAKRAEALASLEVLKQDMDLAMLQNYLHSKTAASIAFGQRCERKVIEEILDVTQLERFEYEMHCDFYETSTLFVLNHFIETGSGVLYYVNCFENRYRVIKVTLLPHF